MLFLKNNRPGGPSAAVDTFAARRSQPQTMQRCDMDIRLFVTSSYVPGTCHFDVDARRRHGMASWYIATKEVFRGRRNLFFGERNR